MIDANEILSMLPHRYPMLLVDRVTEYVPGEYILGYKNITFNEPQFQGHFPGNPIFPGVLIIEGMAQLAGILAMKTMNRGLADRKAAVIVGVDGARFKRPAVPGDQLMMRADMLSVKRNIWKFRLESRIDGQLAAEAELLCTERDA